MYKNYIYAVSNTYNFSSLAQEIQQVGIMENKSQLTLLKRQIHDILSKEQLN